MVRPSPAAKAWLDDFRAESRRRGLRFVSGEAFVVDDVYLASLDVVVRTPKGEPERLVIDWSAEIKPLAVDDVLWTAFLPDLVLGPQQRITHRVSGAFQVQPATIAEATREVAADAEPDWAEVFDEFDRVRTAYVTAHPTVADFAAAAVDAPDADATGPARVRTITSLIAAGRGAEAAQFADAAIERGDGGGMASGVDVLKYLSAFAKGPAAYSDFLTSLQPTHRLQVLSETGRDHSTDLARDHHRGRISSHLAKLNGVDPWAVVLDALRPAEPADDRSRLRYLQAAGTADRLVLEFCAPSADADMSVRSVVGRGNGGKVQDVEIPLPRTTERIAASEVFTAAEAAEVFETFYRTDTIGDGFRLRPVEGYTAAGDTLDLREGPHT